MSTDLAALAQGGRTSVAGFVIRLIARLPFLFIASQWYGANALGRLAYAIAIVEFAAQLSTLGLKRGLALHLTGAGKANGAWDAVLVVLGATMIPTALLMLVPEIMFPNSAIKPLDYLMPLVIPAVALSDVMLAALAFRFDVKSTVRARAIIEPWTISIAAIALWWSTPSDGLLVSYALSMMAALVASAIPFVRSYGWPQDWKPRAIELYALARHNAPLAAADAIEWGSRRLDTVILGLFVSPAMVGIYWVAQQIVSVPQKLKTSFDPVLGPVITRALDEGDKAAVARQISQVGFWILAAQLGIGLTLALAGRELMALIGPKQDFVGGNGSLALLLTAEVLASLAVVSEAALIYVARHKNMLVSLAMIAMQAVLTVALIELAKARGLPEGWQAAGAAAALALSLGMGSLAKSALAQSVLGAPVSVWRGALVPAVAAAVIVGLAAHRLPGWAQLAVGLPATLGIFCWVIWTRGFSAEDRALFRKQAQPPP